MHLPTTTFTDRHTVTLGGKRVEMIYLGVAHTPDGAALYFPDEETVFNADIMQIQPPARRARPDGRLVIEALRTITALDFTIAATGHALAGTKQDALESLRYLEDLARASPLAWPPGRPWPRSRSR